jgi:hypothetical protein
VTEENKVAFRHHNKFLVCVTGVCNIKNHNVESWVHAVERNLAEIGIWTVLVICHNIITLNYKLSNLKGHSMMHHPTLKGMAELGRAQDVEQELHSMAGRKD